MKRRMVPIAWTSARHYESWLIWRSKYAITVANILGGGVVLSVCISFQKEGQLKLCISFYNRIGWSCMFVFFNILKLSINSEKKNSAYFKNILLNFYILNSFFLPKTTIHLQLISILPVYWNFCGVASEGTQFFSHTTK